MLENLLKVPIADRVRATTRAIPFSREHFVEERSVDDNVEQEWFSLP